MSKSPIVYRTTHRVKFYDLDPYNHMHITPLLESTKIFSPPEFPSMRRV